ADAKTQPQTTGDRVRALDVSIEYGHRPSRFPMALAALNEGFVQLAYLPKIYRYTWYSDREIMNLPGAKALEQMGDSKAFPVAVQHFAGIAINKISHKVTRGDSEVKIGLKKSFSASKLERVSYTSHPIYALWFYSVGGGRHYPPEAKKDGEDKAKKEMAERRADVLK
ncbi:MAG: hypothetical protein L6Q71_03895, partial [Planctomycetes bacterium]|nr:hypothetical protein [Planctomycetota bacterium]